MNMPTKFYHGGRLGRRSKPKLWEYGAGLYITSHEQTARKYAKGGRKFYEIQFLGGVEIDSVYLSATVCLAFIRANSIRADFSRHIKDGKISASIFNNCCLNSKLTAKKALALADFIRASGIDYERVENPFGWGETMLVVYNLDKIKIL